MIASFSSVARIIPVPSLSMATNYFLRSKTSSSLAILTKAPISALFNYVTPLKFLSLLMTSAETFYSYAFYSGDPGSSAS